MHEAQEVIFYADQKKTRASIVQNKYQSILFLNHKKIKQGLVHRVRGQLRIGPDRGGGLTAEHRQPADRGQEVEDRKDEELGRVGHQGVEEIARRLKQQGFK